MSTSSSLLPAVGRLEDGAGDQHEGGPAAVGVDVAGQDHPAQELGPGAVRADVEADLEVVGDRDVGQSVAVIEAAADPGLELEPLGELPFVGRAVGPLVGEDLDRGVGLLLPPGDLGRLEAVAEDRSTTLVGRVFILRPTSPTATNAPTDQQACRPKAQPGDPVPHGTRDLPVSSPRPNPSPGIYRRRPDPDRPMTDPGQDCHPSFRGSGVTAQLAQSEEIRQPGAFRQSAC